MFLCINCRLYIINQKIVTQAESGKDFQIWFFPRFGRKKWRRSEHAHASDPGLSFRPPEFSPYMGREERRVQGLDYVPCTGHTTVCHSATDASEGYFLVSKSSIFRTLFPCLLKLYTVAYISWCRSVLR